MRDVGLANEAKSMMRTAHRTGRIVGVRSMVRGAVVNGVALLIQSGLLIRYFVYKDKEQGGA